MKLRVWVTVLALACGTALAAQSGSTSDRDTSTKARQHSAAVANDNAPHKEGFIDKTKRAFHRLGEKMRSATHRNSTQQASKDDTRSMGAAGSETQDSSRRRRMDEAYGNWKSKQK